MYKTIIEKQSNLGSIALLGLSNILRNLGYYGFRGILLFFLLDSELNYSNQEVIKLYGLFIGSLVFSKLIGGVLGDLVIGNKNAMIAGVILEVIGLISLSTSTVTGLYIGLTLMTLGAGLYQPNLYSNAGKHYLHNRKFLDSVYTFLYATIIFGALVGPLITLTSQQNNDWNTGFILAGVVLLVSAIPVIFTRNPKNTSIEIDQKQPSILQRCFLITSALLMVGLFWGIYELTSSHSSSLQYAFGEMSSLPIPRTFWSSISSVFIIPLSILFTVLWLFLRIPQFVKLALGFILANLSFILLVSIPQSPSESHTLFYIVSLILFNFAEILIQPTLNTILARYTNPKYLGITMSLSFAPASFFMWLIVSLNIQTEENSLSLMIGGTIAISCVTSMLVLFVIIKRFTTLKSV